MSLAFGCPSPTWGTQAEVWDNPQTAKEAYEGYDRFRCHRETHPERNALEGISHIVMIRSPLLPYSGPFAASISSTSATSLTVRTRFPKSGVEGI